MRFVFFVLIFFAIQSCRSSRSNISADTIAKDSLTEENVRLLKDYAICQCLYAVPENESVKNLDVSAAVYANLLNYSGTDTLGKLARIQGEQITWEKYVDYHNKKAGFFRCSQWANSPAIVALIRKYAALAAKAEN